jgi:hypothetical protein
MASGILPVKEFTGYQGILIKHVSFLTSPVASDDAAVAASDVAAAAAEEAASADCVVAVFAAEVASADAPVCVFEPQPIRPTAIIPHSPNEINFFILFSFSPRAYRTTGLAALTHPFLNDHVLPDEHIT